MDENVPYYISILFIALTFALFYFFMFGFKFALSRVDYPENKKRKIFLWVPIGVFVWLVFLALISFNGFFLEFKGMPPRILLAVLPPLVVIVVSIFSGTLDPLLLKIRPWWLINLQSFRVMVEIILWLLFLENIIPVQMTFEGFNYDILVGLTAIPVSYLCFRRRKFFYKPLIVWNILGILILLNIVTIAILSTPSDLRYFMNEPANTVIGYYPFIWLPGFVVPMALFLHLASLRQIKLKDGPILDF
jgi:hypothetical protein